MSEFTDIIHRLNARYPDLVLDPSGESAEKFITTQADLKLYDGKAPGDWELIDKKTKGVTLVKDVEDSPKKLIVLEFLDFYNSVKKEIQEKAPIENLKAGGFKGLGSENESTTSEEDEEEAAKATQEEENARKREENERKLAMADEAEAAEYARNEQKKAVNSKSSINPSVPETHDMFEDRPVEYVEPPAPKKGEVNLLDVFTPICKNDLMQIFGNTGTGKTSICTKLALDARGKGKTVLYIDTEHNINDDQIAAMQNAGIKYEYIKKFQKLCEYIKGLPALQKYGVVIIDSIGAPALAAFCKSDMRGKGTILQNLISASDNLKDYATDNNSLVVAINQPESSMNKGEDAILEPFGEKSRYYYKEILKTNYARNGRKTGKTTLVLRAHRSRCMGIDTDICTMEITNNGVKVIQ